MEERKLENYALVQGANSDNNAAVDFLLEGVAKRAQEGYVPLGGVSVTTSGVLIIYAQAMVKWVHDAD